MVDKAPIKVLLQYLKYTNVFSFNLAIELRKNISINEYIIELMVSKQSLYGPIYSLGSMELKTLKTYIKTNLKSGFIQLSKSFVDISIFSDHKLNKNFRLYINY